MTTWFFSVRNNRQNDYGLPRPCSPCLDCTNSCLVHPPCVVESGTFWTTFGHQNSISCLVCFLTLMLILHGICSLFPKNPAVCWFGLTTHSEFKPNHPTTQLTQARLNSAGGVKEYFHRTSLFFSFVESSDALLPFSFMYSIYSLNFDHL